jgi:hypothetical protein
MIEYTVKVSDDGSKEWYLNGKQLSEKEFNESVCKPTPEYGYDGHPLFYDDNTK